MDITLNIAESNNKVILPQRGIMIIAPGETRG